MNQPQNVEEPTETEYNMCHLLRDNFHSLEAKEELNFLELWTMFNV